jgi:hypothetical protein
MCNEGIPTNTPSEGERALKELKNVKYPTIYPSGHVDDWHSSFYSSDLFLCENSCRMGT